MLIRENEPPWLRFQHRWVRELAFSIASAPLLACWPVSLPSTANHFNPAQNIDLPDHGFWQQHFVNYLPRLQQLDRYPQPLEQHMQHLRSWRIGIRFEHLLAFWLQDSAYHAFTLLDRGIKRMHGHRTIGEMDFLLFNQDTQCTEHWEVAIKFYLGEASLSPAQWLGTNRRDSLDRKLNHLCQHQFNIMNIQGRSIDVRRAIVKGRLFYPAWNHHSFSTDSLGWATPQHLTGYWGYTIPDAPAGFTWRYASRQEWMVVQPELNRATRTSEHPHSYHPTYWRAGLYLLLNTENKVVLHYMLRIADKMHKSLKNNNTLKPNPNAADIFNQISII